MQRVIIINEWLSEQVSQTFLVKNRASNHQQRPYRVVEENGRCYNQHGEAY